MDLTLITSEPHPTSSAMLLAIVGILSFFPLRRWPRTVVVVAPVILLVSGILMRNFAPMLASLARPDVPSVALVEAGICAVAAAIGLGLPIIAWRSRSRSRPAT